MTYKQVYLIGKQAIIFLMDHMEQQKYEAIQFTFRQVSRNN